MGNQLLITPLIQEVSETFPDSKIDVFVKGSLGQVIFKNLENVDTIIQLPKKHFKNLLEYILVWLRMRRQCYDMAINVARNSS